MSVLGVSIVIHSQVLSYKRDVAMSTGAKGNTWSLWYSLLAIGSNTILVVRRSEIQIAAVCQNFHAQYD